jgi:hypothetical protein
VEKAMEPDHGYNVDQAEREKLRAERISRLEGEDPPINEQMARSREIETIGVEEWKRLQDQRPIEEQPIIVKNYIAGGDVLNTPIEGGSQKRVPGITHPIAETPQKAPVRNPDGSLPRA